MTLKMGVGVVFWIALNGYMLSGCTSMSPKQETTAGASPAEKDFALGTSEIESFRANEPDLPEMAVPEFDNIPDDVRPLVQKWLDYFQGRGREHMERYLSRSTRYERLMKRILRENQVPEDIIYIALIESGFSPRAISRARAVGYWQFIRGTGRRYGLAINTFVDERRDPVLATQAAADYFKGLYGEFNSWFLSMASYNVGEGRVRREMNRTRSRDFWEIAKRRRLPKETINYVPKFLAARLIAKKPEAYGFKDIPYEPPIEFETAHFNQAINMRLLAEKMDIDYAEVKRLNPKYRGEIAPLEANKLELRLPLNMKESALALASEVAVKQYVFIPDRGETDVYKVRRGDTLVKIAHQFKTTVGYLKEINEFKKRSRLRPGRTIFVPIPSVVLPNSRLVASREGSGTSVNGEKTASEKVSPEFKSTKNLAKTNGSIEAAKPSDENLYLVQDGESLAEVATKNNMTIEELMELNDFTEGQTIATGMQIKVRKIQPETGEPSLDDLPTSMTVVENEKSGTSINLSSEVALQESLKKEIEQELFHKVLPGETLFSIAQRYKTTVLAIKKANNLTRRRTLRAGAVLKIPKKDFERKTTGSSSSSQRWPHYATSELTSLM